MVSIVRVFAIKSNFSGTVSIQGSKQVKLHFCQYSRIFDLKFPLLNENTFQIIKKMQKIDTRVYT